MITKLQTLVLAMAALLFAGCTQKAGTPETVMDMLSQASESGCFIFGHQDGLSYGKNWKVDDYAGDDLTRSDVKAVCGQYPAMIGFDLGGIELGNDANLDGVPFDFMRRAARMHVSRGGIVTFSWHPRNPKTGGDAWDVSDPETVASILEGGENHEMFLQWLDRAAEFLGSLEVPVIFRPWHENIGSWFWWGGRLCTAEQYKALFTLTYERLKGIKDMIWVYSPNADASWESYMERYPGDDIIDIVGFDCYMFNSNEAFIAQMRTALENVSTYAKAHGKLYCVSETGYTAIPEAGWWTGTLLKAVEGYNPCYLLVWRNAWDQPAHYFAPYEGSPDSENFKEFVASGRPKLLTEK
ncbi:MAG: beta-mannosidase [Bacteroidales bacterium]|nr:beta-mannosidase [Bacteroidales bacterium]